MLGQTKHRTRQYAKSQLQWIRKQFLPAVAEAKALGGDVQVYAVRGGTDDEVATRNILHRRFIHVLRPVLTALQSSCRELGYRSPS